MYLKRFQRILLLVSLLCLNIVLFRYIENEVQKRKEFSFETGMEQFVNFHVSSEQIDAFYDAAAGNMPEFLSLLTIYFGTGCKTAEVEELRTKSEEIYVNNAAEFESLYQYLTAVFYDMTCFPVGTVANLPSAVYSYIDSWQFERTYGGERGHEGCDIMASLNKRGVYPIYSATDGVIENIGWLKLGGWRIGIRSNSGAYYYYAHLSEYAEEFAVGERIKAGTLLGFMGDSGYSEEEGTVGKFDVHLHFGIYFNDQFGNEYAINPYPVLYFCEQKQKGKFHAD